MIKRFSCILLSIVLLMSVSCIGGTGGSPQTTMQPDETDTQETTAPTDDAQSPSGEKSYCFDFRRTAEGSLITAYTPILETDEAVYYLFDGTLYFSDKVYKEFLPLCAKPNCDHESKNCDAKIDAMNMHIWIYDRYIYYVIDNAAEGEPNEVTHPSLCRMRLDGTRHEEVMRLPEQQLDYTPQYTDWGMFFSSKYLFVTHVAYKKSAAMGGTPDTALFGIDLDTMEVKQRHGSFAPIYACGDIVYSFVPESDENDEYIVRFYEYNMQTDESRQIGTEREWFYALNECYGVKDGEILYVTADRADLSAMRLWGMNIETGEKRLLYSTDNIYGSKWHPYLDYTNGYYLKSYKGYNDGPEEETRPNWGLYVTDTSGNVVSKYLYEEMPEDFFETWFILQTESYIFAGPPGEDGGISIACSIPTWYLDKSEIAAGKPEWHRWAPED
ncbi:MAG: hypothetical protein IKI64_09490 [Clostridia bacterium]|nr:hypothetical protein [Clostridia bacterium]